jgi:O-succinylbenzoate synthase
LDVRRSLLIELEDDEGVVGLGESAPFEEPFYSSETIATARDVLREVLFPTVVGGVFERLEDLHDAIEGVAPRSPMARAGIETAWWDLNAASEGTSLRPLVTRRFEELGVRCAAVRSVRCGVALGLPRDGHAEDLAARTVQAANAGYHRIKVKIDRAWHVDAVRTAQRALCQADMDLPITVDANGAFVLARDRGVLKALDAMGLLYIEQPFAAEDIEAHVELATSLTTPVCLDETLSDQATARNVSQRRGKWVWNIKVQRVGGLEPACRMVATARDAGIPMWVGTMPESGVGAQASLALAAHDLFAFPTDVEPSDRWYLRGVDPIELTMASDGTMRVPEERPHVESRRFPSVFELDVGG